MQNNNRESSTRHRILYWMKRKGSVTVYELSELLDITEMAVRRHLTNLERDGYVGVKIARQPVGRPLHQYYLTPLAEKWFPNKYEEFALDLLTEVKAAEEPVLERFYERMTDKIFRQYHSAVNGQTLGERVVQLAEARQAEGLMVEVESRGSGYALYEFHCPIAKVAPRACEVCDCERDAFARLLDANVRLAESMARGDGRCTYLIEA